MIDSKKKRNIFQEAANEVNKDLLEELKIDIAVVEMSGCVVLKLYKKTWMNASDDSMNARTRIFFSIWTSDESNTQQKIFYNIHAFKLREFKGYSIESRKFAASFRADFKTTQQRWPNLSVSYGPLTLMQGWLTTNLESFQIEITGLIDKFLEIAPLIDSSLSKFKREQRPERKNA